MPRTLGGTHNSSLTTTQRSAHEAYQPIPCRKLEQVHSQLIMAMITRI